MTNITPTAYRDRFFRTLLALALLINTFFLPGYVEFTQEQQREESRVEWLLSNEGEGHSAKATKQIQSFWPCDILPSITSNTLDKHWLWQQNRLCQIKLASLAHPDYIIPSIRFYSKIIPASSDEELLYTHLG